MRIGFCGKCCRGFVALKRHITHNSSQCRGAKTPNRSSKELRLLWVECDFACATRARRYLQQALHSRVWHIRAHAKLEVERVAKAEGMCAPAVYIARRTRPICHYFEFLPGAHSHPPCAPKKVSFTSAGDIGSQQMQARALFSCLTRRLRTHLMFFTISVSVRP